MKLRVLITKFWENLFGSKGTLSEAPEAPQEPKYMPQNQQSTSPLQPPKNNPTGPEETQELGEKKEKPPESAKRSRLTQPKVRNQKGSPETGPTKESNREEPAKTQTNKEAGNLVVRSELNLEQNSVFAVSTYRGKSREITRRENAQNGAVTERTVIIGKTIDGVETGVLTTHHFKLYLALLELWEKAGRPIDEPVHFTILRIIKRLGMIDAGSNYEMIKRHLVNLRQIPLTFTDSFFISGEEGFNSLRPFSILSYLDIYERKYNNKSSEQTTRGYGEFRFDDHILTSLANNYAHPLRLDVITEFKKHKDVAILLYTYIDRNMAFKTNWEIGLEKLYEHLDLSQSYIQYPSQRKKKIVPVLQQLRGKPLSTGTLSYCEVRKTDDGKDYKLVCRKKPFAKSLRQMRTPQQLTSELESEIKEPHSEVTSLLIQRGLTQKQTGKLLSERGEEIARTQLTYLPFRLEEYEAQGKQVKEAAILYDSIKDNWHPPKSYFEAEKKKEQKAKVKALEEEYKERVEKAKAQAEEWAARPPEDRVTAPLSSWIWGEKQFNHHEPTEEEIEAKKEELISNLQTKKQYERQLVDEIEKDIQSKKHRITG